MKIGLAMGSLGILGILALADCAGASGSVSVSGTGDATRLTLSGGYTLVGDNGDTITGTIAVGNPLVWIPTACKYPSSGALTLNRVGNAGTDQTTASFASGCGNLNVGGAIVALGGS